MAQNFELECLYCRGKFTYTVSDAIASQLETKKQQSGKAALVLMNCPSCLGPLFFDPSRNKKGLHDETEIPRIKDNYGDLVQDLAPTQHLQDQLSKFTDEGRRFAVQGQFERAAEAYGEALKIVPRNPETWQNLGVVRNQSGDLAGAAEAFYYATMFNPRNFMGWNNLGMIYAQANLPDKAEECFDRCIAVNPDYVKAYLGKGNVFLLRGDLVNARKYYEIALQKDPNYVPAKEALRQIRNR